MREERKRKALYVNRREDLYAESLLKKERAPAKTRKGATRKKARASASKSAR